MNRKLIIIITIVAAILAGVVYLLTTSSDTSPTSTPTRSSSNTSQPNPSDTAGSESATLGAYKDYEASAIENTTGAKLLFFHAPWCPQCRALEADIKKQNVPSGVTIFKVDYDSSQNLRQKYGVTLQTTIVQVDDNGDLVKKFVAYDDPTLDAIKNTLLN